MIVRDVLDATESQGASVGMRFCAASATGFCHRSLANRFGTADDPHPEPANGLSRLGPCTRDRWGAAFRLRRSCRGDLGPEHSVRPHRVSHAAAGIPRHRGAGIGRARLAGAVARLDAAGERQPDEVRRYRILLNDEPAGQEVFRFWREARIRVLVDTSLEADVLIFSADLRHCRDERWQEEAGELELVELESATHSAVLFRPDYEIHIERDRARGDMVTAAHRVSARLRSAIPRIPGRRRRGRPHGRV